MSYPIWKYHKEKLPEGKIFRSQAEFEAAGDGWVESPALFDVIVEVKGDQNEPSEEPVILSSDASVDLPEKPVDKKVKAKKEPKAKK